MSQSTLEKTVTFAWLVVIAAAAANAGAASEGVSQWIWPVIVVLAVLGQMAFNRVQHHRRLREEELFRTITDAVPYALFYKDCNSRYLGVNRAFTEAFGTQREDVTGRRDIDLFGPELHERFLQQDRELLASRSERTFEEVMPKNGEQRVLEARKTPFFGPDGKLLGIVGVAVDVTAHRRQERELREANFRLQHALSALEQSRIDFDLALLAGDLGVWRTAFSNDDIDREVNDLADAPVEWDANARRIAGLPDNKPLTQRDIVKLVHPDDRERLWAAMISALRTGGGRFSDCSRLIRPDGEVRMVAIRAAVTYWPTSDAREVVRGLTGILRDITDEEALKVDLQQKAREARHADEAKSKFMAIVSHEIRTPMNGIIGMLELLLSTPLRDEQRTMMVGAKNSAFVLMNILNDVLDFSKIEAGQLTIERVPILLHDVVTCATSAWLASAYQKGLSLEATIAPQVPRCVFGDRTRLNQVLMNLIGNAVKFTPQGSVNVVVTSRPRDNASPSRTAVRFDVIDTGIGMDRAAKEKLFRPFQQANVSTTRHFGGTGLGLAIVKHLVEAMNGRVECESALGVGSRFTVTLQMDEAPYEPGKLDAAADDELHVYDTPPSVSRASEEATGRLILVAEDNAMNREVLARQLSHLGYACDMALDGEDAWSQLRSGTRYALLLTDGHMPNLDGYELAKRVRDHEALHGEGRLPIIAITANALPGELERCLALGMDGYLPKPLLTRDLKRTLKRFLPEPPRDTSTKDRELSVEPLNVASPRTFAPVFELAKGDRNAYQHLLSVFVETATSDLRAFEHAIRASDWPRVQDIAHRMKSACSQLGEDRSASLFKSVETSSAEEMEQGKTLEAALKSAAGTLSRVHREILTMEQCRSIDPQ